MAGAEAPAAPDPRRAAPKRDPMKKSIHLWAFPYPDRMNLQECLQLAKDAGFEYFHPYPHYPEVLIYQTSDSLDRILGRKR